MDNNNYPSEEAKKALIGLSRDLRGLALASNTRSHYMMFFDWMYVYRVHPDCDLFYKNES